MINQIGTAKVAGHEVKVSLRFSVRVFPGRELIHCTEGHPGRRIRSIQALKGIFVTQTREVQRRAEHANCVDWTEGIVSFQSSPKLYLC